MAVFDVLLIQRRAGESDGAGGCQNKDEDPHGKEIVSGCRQCLLPVKASTSGPGRAGIGWTLVSLPREVLTNLARQAGDLLNYWFVWNSNFWKPDLPSSTL